MLLLFAANDVAVAVDDNMMILLPVLYRILHTVCRYCYCFRIYLFLPLACRVERIEGDSDDLDVGGLATSYYRRWINQ